MSKLSELDKTVKQYIINAIDPDYCEARSVDPLDLIIGLKAAFHAECQWNIDRVGEQEALTDWLRGLPSAINIEFTNYEILKLAHKWGSIPENATEKQEDKILDNYWNFMANKIGQLFRGYRVPSEV